MEGMVAETVYSLSAAAIFNLLAHYTLIYDWGWGFDGAPIALSITHLSLPAFLWFFVKRSGCHKVSGTHFSFFLFSFLSIPFLFLFPFLDLSHCCTSRIRGTAGAHRL